MRIESVSRTVAERLTARGLVPWRELERHIQRTQLLQVSLSAAPGGGVHIEGTLDLGGRRVRAAATTQVRLEAQTLVIEPTSVTLDGETAELEEQIRDQVARLLSFRIPTGALPRGIKVNHLVVRPDGLLVAVVGADVPVGP